MAHEDTIVMAAVMAKGHIEGLQAQGVYWFTSDVPTVTRHNDVLSLEFFIYLMKRNEYDAMAVSSNLDDILSWATFLAASENIKYIPIVSTNDGTPAHMTPEEVVTWAAAKGVRMGLQDVHYFALNTMWWAIYISKQVEGTVAAAVTAQEIAERIDAMEEEE